MGKLILISGLDGCGKSTQVEKLIEKLGRENTVVLHYSNFKGNVFSEMINEYLQGDYGEVSEIHPKLISLMFAQNRLSYKEQIDKHIAEGRTVILDRYVEDNMAFQSGKYEDKDKAIELIRFINKLEYTQNQMPKPDVAIFIKAPMKHIEQVNEARKEEYKEYSKRDIHEEDFNYLKRVGDMFDFLVARSMIKELDVRCPKSGDMLDKDTVHKKILNLLSSEGIGL